MQTSEVFRVNGVRVGVIGSVVRNTPELVKPENTAGLEFLDEADRIRRESAKLRARGVKVQVVVIHEGATAGANAVDGRPPVPWEGPIIGIVDELQDTTVDLVVAGHTHRAANTMVGRIPVVEGFNAGISYSVAQLMVEDGDVRWTAAATRLAKNLGVAPRPDVKAIVDKANADTAPLRNVVIGSQTADILRDNPARLKESALGNLVTDAMRPEVRRARGSRPRSRTRAACAPTWCSTASTGGELPGPDHLGRGVRRAAVRQLDGDRDAHLRAARRGARERATGRRAATRRAAPGARRSSRACGSSSTATAPCR